MVKSLKNTKYFIQYYKKQIGIFIFIVLTILGFRTFALSEEQFNDSNGILKFCYSMIDEICGQETVEEIAEKVAVGFDAGGISVGGYSVGGISGIIREINNISIGLAVLIICMTVFIGFMNTRSQDVFEDDVLRKLVLMGISIVIAFFSMDICFGIANVGTGFANSILSVYGASASHGDVAGIIDTIKTIMYEESHVTGAIGVVDKIKEIVNNLVTPFGYLIQLLIPWLATKVAWVAINVVCWGRAIEILVLAAFSPLAFSDLVDTHNYGNGSGSRFIKNFAALSLSGAVILTVMIMCSTVAIQILGQAAGSGTFNDFISSCWNLVIISFAEVGLCMRAQSISKTVCGIG